MKKKAISFFLLLTMLISTIGCFSHANSPRAGKDEKYSVTEFEYKCIEYASMSPEEIVASLSLEQKAAQMVMPAIIRCRDTVYLWARRCSRGELLRKCRLLPS